MLSKSRLSDLVKHKRCGIPIEIEVEGEGRRKVIWHVLSEYQEQVRIIATLTPASPTQTRVDVSLWNAREGERAYIGDAFYPRPALSQPLLPAAREQVAALLERRPYDKEPPKTSESYGTFQVASRDGTCSLQRSAHEQQGEDFSIHDVPPEALSGFRL